jgi:uncharacterized protein
MLAKPILRGKPVDGRSPILSVTEVRAIVLRSQGLAESVSPFGLGKMAVLKAIQHLGYIQVDPINVLQRAHHHVLWSRVPNYHPNMLHQLQDPDAAVFEYWNHAASYLPMTDYRFSMPLMRKYRGEFHWSDDSPELRNSMRRLLTMIRKQGPLMLSEVESTGSVDGWSAGRTSKIERRALHELWMRGDIMIRSRHGVQKIFDLPSRVLPAGMDIKIPSKSEAAEFHARRALRALGVATPQELHYLQDAGQASAVRGALSALIRRGETVEVRVPDLPKSRLFALQEALEFNTPVERKIVRFLSPFDNLTIQRKRLNWLFDFDYVAEIYVPIEKRKYGYFVLPILWGDRLIGRMDAKANRAERQLVIHNLVFEPTFHDFEGVKPAFGKALNDFTRFQECDQWKISRVEPKAFSISGSSPFRVGNRQGKQETPKKL